MKNNSDCVPFEDSLAQPQEEEVPKSLLEVRLKMLIILDESLSHIIASCLNTSVPFHGILNLAVLKKSNHFTPKCNPQMHQEKMVKEKKKKKNKKNKKHSTESSDSESEEKKKEKLKKVCPRSYLTSCLVGCSG